MIKQKTSRPYEGNESKILNGGKKGQASNPKKYRGKKLWNKPIPEPEDENKL